jgi:hypothetical protein
VNGDPFFPALEKAIPSLRHVPVSTEVPDAKVPRRKPEKHYRNTEHLTEAARHQINTSISRLDQK